MKPLARPALEIVRRGKVKFVPQRWEGVYFNWMNNIRDWCISRQLWGGHQIPGWYGEDNTFFVARTEEEALAQAREHYRRQEITLRRDPDVLDTWFSSWLWPFATLGWQEQSPDFARYYPTDNLITAPEIIFFWVARMIMAGEHFCGELPFDTVYIHGTVRDPQGRKMSKSLGNGIDPLDVVEQYGRDALRFTLISQAGAGQDLFIISGFTGTGQLGIVIERAERRAFGRPLNQAQIVKSGSGRAIDRGRHADIDTSRHSARG